MRRIRACLTSRNLELLRRRLHIELDDERKPDLHCTVRDAQLPHALRHETVCALKRTFHRLCGRVTTQYKHGIEVFRALAQPLALPLRPNAHHRGRRTREENVCTNAALLKRISDEFDVVLEDLGLEAMLEELDERLVICPSPSSVARRPDIRQ